MTARRLLLVALALAAGCKATSTRPSIRLSGPAAVAVFKAYTTRDPANLRTYLAVANERGDDLRILDAIDGASVLAPALVQSLSVPTSSRPSMLAAGSLGETGAAAGADLLAVASTGLVACDPANPTRLTGCVQVLATWLVGDPPAPNTALATSLAVILDDVPGGEAAEVLSLAVAPVPEPDGAGGWVAAAGRARILAGLSGGRLLVAEYQRAGGAIVKASEAVHDVGFDPEALSPSPEHPGKVYAASLDPIGGAQGVAELDLTGPAPTVRALPAGLGTTHVLAVKVRLFKSLDAGLATGDVTVDPDPAIDEVGGEVLRVYAALDPERCGRSEAVTCGLAVLDPAAGGPAEDPTTDPLGKVQGHLPIAIPGRVTALGAVYPPALGSLTGANGEVYQKVATESAFRWTSTLAVVGSSNGTVYLVDLSRGALAIDRDLLKTEVDGRMAGVTSVDSKISADASQTYLGLWDLRGGANPTTRDPKRMPDLVTMTPGYTQSETFTLAWEGVLPQLSSLTGQVQTGAAGAEWVAVQSAAFSDLSAPPYRGVARLYDPRFFIRTGDIVVVTPAGVPGCEKGTQDPPIYKPIEYEVASFRLPDPDGAPSLHPGGALAVVPRPAGPDGLQPGGGKPSCLNGQGRIVATITVRASGLLLTGSAFGYAGRPVPAATEADPPFALQWEDTSARSCPPLETSAWPPPPCDDACRQACEDILVARKARRSSYVASQCATSDTKCRGRHLDAPVVNPFGPVISFSPAWVDEAGQLVDAPAPVRERPLVINVQSGQIASVRRPLSGTSVVGAVQPTGVASFDRAGATQVETAGVRAFVSFPSNLVLDFSPAAPASLVSVYK